MKRKANDDSTWSWWLKQQIEEIDLEIAEAHEAIKGKMTTVASSGHPIMQVNNLVTPIVPHWNRIGQEGILH